MEGDNAMQQGHQKPSPGIMSEIVPPVLWIACVLTVVRTALVVDAVYDVHKAKGLAARVSTWCYQRNPGATTFPALTDDSSAPSAPAAAHYGPSARSRNPRSFRLLHLRLVTMHLVATIQQCVGVAQYLMPISDDSCIIQQRVAMAVLIVFDATLVLFLTAKTSVTTGGWGRSGPLSASCCERAVGRFSQFVGWIYLPATAVLCYISIHPAGANYELNECHGDHESNHAKEQPLLFSTAFLAGKVVLIVELVVLLLIFLRPLARIDAYSEASAAAYTRVVQRNIICTAAILAVQVVNAIVVAYAATRKSREMDQVEDVVGAVQVFLTLCLTEITIPYGFLSCYKTCKDAKRQPDGGRKPFVNPTNTEQGIRGDDA